MHPDATLTAGARTQMQPSPRFWVSELTVTDFRNYRAARAAFGPAPVVLTGPNGAGKTNLLEAVSLLAPGRGLRGRVYADLSRHDGGGGWAVAGCVQGPDGEARLGTGLNGANGANGAKADDDEAGGARAVRIDGRTKRGPGDLARHVRCLWLTPAMDGVFSGAAGERRRFLDRMVAALDPAFRTVSGRFERAMRQRNRLLETDRGSAAEFAGVEAQLAEAGVAMAASRRDAVARLAGAIETARDTARDGADVFPWASVALEGRLEADLAHCAAVDAEDAYRARLSRSRPRDAAAGRTLEGPHRSDLLVGHGPKGCPAKDCSTGEQKALLIGLVLAQAALVKRASGGWAPLLLMDEVAAHLDPARRQGLFAALQRLGAQAWMTGTEPEIFAAIGADAQRLSIENGRIIGDSSEAASPSRPRTAHTS